MKPNFGTHDEQFHDKPCKSDDLTNNSQGLYCMNCDSIIVWKDGKTEIWKDNKLIRRY